MLGRLPWIPAFAGMTKVGFSLSHRLIVKYWLFADLDDVLGEDHFLPADPRRVAGCG
jgi:hypothetical protein